MTDYRVTIAYEEPTYRSDGRVYEFSWRFAAASAAEARARALQEFDALWLLSSVGWVREIVRVTVEPVGPGRCDVALSAPA